jgi:hypothetical protein
MDIDPQSPDYIQPNWQVDTVNQINRLILYATPVPTAAARMRVEVHHFDLIELEQRCLEALETEQVLIGLALPYDSTTLLHCLKERLHQSWGRNRLVPKEDLTINPQYRTVLDAISIITKDYIPTLAKRDVLCVVRVLPIDLEDFWRNLCRCMTKYTYKHSLIIILVVNTESQLPAGIISLPQPRFEITHIRQWTQQVVDERTWPNDFADFWRRHMNEKCSIDNELKVDLVYNYLRQMLKLLQIEESHRQFQQKLEEEEYRFV